ncbi:hypothetical protein YB2330_005970 [Saitoella coloradoensis]
MPSISDNISPHPSTSHADNIWIAASEGKTDKVLAFLAADPTLGPSVSDFSGYTPIHAAASYNHVDLLKQLLSLPGANPNAGDSDGDTPLYVCETVECAQLLLEAGADPSWRNKEGKSVLEHFEEEGDALAVADYLYSVLGQQPPPRLPENADLQMRDAEQEGEDTVDVEGLEPAMKAQIDEIMTTMPEGPDRDARLADVVREAIMGQYRGDVSRQRLE